MLLGNLRFAACIADVIYFRLLTPTKQLPNSRSQILVLSPQRTQKITGNVFRISFKPYWEIDNFFLNRPTMARTEILEHRWRAQ